MPPASCKFKSDQATCGQQRGMVLGETAGGRMLCGQLPLDLDTASPDSVAQRSLRPGDPGGPSRAQPLPRARLMRTEINWPHSRDSLLCPTLKMGGPPEGRGHIWSWGPSSPIGSSRQAGYVGRWTPTRLLLQSALVRACHLGCGPGQPV